eukprot:gene22944-30124_t
MSEKKEDQKVPVTVVTGFLGAGKTTLVNHILTGNHGKKIAVIENEFGEVGIDDALVLPTSEDIYEMNNGCVCCTVRGDLIRIVNKLLKRKGKFDAIMIETTGLANPAPVIQTFFVDEDIKDGCFLDAVLTVVDIKHITQHLDDEKPDGVVNEAIQQIAFADKILLNKIDLVTPEEKAAVVKRIRAINKPVDIIETTKCTVDLSLVLGIKAFSLDKMLTQDPDFLEDGTHHHDHDDKHDHEHEHKHDAAGAECNACDHDHAHGHHHGEGEEHHHHKHEHDTDGKHHDDCKIDGECDMAKLNEWLSKLLQEKGPDLFRSKGVLCMKGSDDKHVFQGVHMLLQFSSSADGVGAPWKEGEKRTNKIVFIANDR